MDLDYLSDGETVVCGRAKDVIIIGGRNIYPSTSRTQPPRSRGVRAGNTAAVRLEAGSERERFAVLAESRHAGGAEQERLLRGLITSRVVDSLGVRPASVHILGPSTLPKTSSGKLRRSAADRLLDPGRPAQPRGA
ncbi:hypothetical protein [Streptomyces spiramenti]|uniref:AMP-binding enzyme C-terminal domain-containing protein n=1 Tax=Streptomyces spiramenti TaxID=2720606 RepID=A0ABX1AIG5_9ACTN|nr:hypothetical protein [Streptomyces spiramenti]NJP65173.1 hypothetical protein [Streptomyces spiramenti]